MVVNIVGHVWPINFFYFDQETDKHPTTIRMQKSINEYGLMFRTDVIMNSCISSAFTQKKVVNIKTITASKQFALYSIVISKIKRQINKQNIRIFNLLHFSYCWWDPSTSTNKVTSYNRFPNFGLECFIENVGWTIYGTGQMISQCIIILQKCKTL